MLEVGGEREPNELVDEKITPKIFIMTHSRRVNFEPE